MKYITFKYLKKIGACIEAVQYFVEQNKQQTALAWINHLVAVDKTDWATWFICRVFNHTQQIQYAIFAAEQVIDNFEKQWPDDKRPRQAIEAAKTYLKQPNKENKKAVKLAAESAARSASESAWSAARSAWLAARSAWLAARSAWLAESASESAWSASESAWSASESAWLAESASESAWSASESAWLAWSASRSAGSAFKERQLKILNYGIMLLEEKHE